MLGGGWLDAFPRRNFGKFAFTRHIVKFICQSVVIDLGFNTQLMLPALPQTPYLHIDYSSKLNSGF